MKPLLPPVKPKDSGKICVVIDLDETLVHSSFKVGRLKCAASNTSSVSHVITLHHEIVMFNDNKKTFSERWARPPPFWLLLAPRVTFLSPLPNAKPKLAFSQIQINTAAPPSACTLLFYLRLRRSNVRHASSLLRSFTRLLCRPDSL